MRIHIRMIGTGSAFAKAYYNNNALVSCSGFTLLIDCGITAPLALHQLNVPFDRIDGVYITHLHGDHAGGLEEFAFQMRYKYNKKPTLFIGADLIEPLWEHSLKAGMMYTTEGELTLEDYFNIVPLREGIRTELHPGFTLEIMRTFHFPKMPSYSCVLNDEIFYSGDVVFDEKLIHDMYRSRNCTVLFHDCQLQGAGSVHATLDELLTLPEDIQERLMLMHYGDDMPAYIGRTGKMTFVEQHKLYTFETRRAPR